MVILLNNFYLFPTYFFFSLLCSISFSEFTAFAIGIYIPFSSVERSKMLTSSSGCVVIGFTFDFWQHSKSISSIELRSGSTLSLQPNYPFDTPVGHCTFESPSRFYCCLFLKNHVCQRACYQFLLGNSVKQTFWYELLLKKNSFFSVRTVCLVLEIKLCDFLYEFFQIKKLLPMNDILKFLPKQVRE